MAYIKIDIIKCNVWVLGKSAISPITIALIVRFSLNVYACLRVTIVHTCRILAKSKTVNKNYVIRIRYRM